MLYFHCGIVIFFFAFFVSCFLPSHCVSLLFQVLLCDYSYSACALLTNAACVVNLIPDLIRVVCTILSNWKYTLSPFLTTQLYLTLPGAVRCAFATLSFQLNFVQSFLPEISELSLRVRRASSTAVAKETTQRLSTRHTLYLGEVLIIFSCV